MGFTFDLETTIGRIRAEVGDTEEASYVLSDEEITDIITEASDFLGQCLLAAGRIVSKLSLNSYDVQAGSQKEASSQRLGPFREVQKRVRGKWLLSKLGA